MAVLSPKHVLISQQIEAHIREGRWADGRLPGLRSLAQDYDTSVVTASRALQELVDRGVVQTVERSGCFVRTELFSVPTVTETWGLCLRLTPGPWRLSTEAFIRERFAQAGRRDGYCFRDNLFPLLDELSEAELTRQARDAKAAGVSGLFYLPARVGEAAAKQDEAVLRACATAHLPVVFLERGLRGDRPLTVDLIGYDDFEAGRAITHHLIETGRRRPAFVVGSPTHSHQVRQAGYLFAMHGAAVPPCVIEQPGDLPLKDAYAAIADRVLESNADAVFCYQDYTAVGVIIELLNRGKRVPGDVAVTGVEDLPIATSFSIGLTTYAFSFEELSRRAVRLMRDRIRNPNDPPIRVTIGGRLIVRESSVGKG